MRERKSIGLCLLLFYVAICTVISVWTIIETKSNYLFFSVPNNQVLFFLGLIGVNFVIPAFIIVWVVITYKKEEKNVTAKTLSGIFSIILSLFVSCIWMFFSLGQSYTDNVENYGISDKKAAIYWDEATKFFPKDLTEYEYASYKYQYSVGDARHVLYDVTVYFSSEEEYEIAIDKLEKNKFLNKIGESYIYKLTAFNEKAYVATDYLALEYHYEYGNE